MISKLKIKAKQDLQGNFLLAILAMVVYTMITSAVQSIPQYGFLPMIAQQGTEIQVVTFVIGLILFTIATILIGILILPYLQMGYYKFHLRIGRTQEARFEDLFDGFKEKYKERLQTIIYLTVIVLGWTLPYLIFVIAGALLVESMAIIGGTLMALGFLYLVFLIIKLLDYSFVLYLLIDPEFDTFEPIGYIKESKRMMQGNKWTFILLGLSFILWILLVIVTFGLAALYVGPYAQQAYTNLYLELKK